MDATTPTGTTDIDIIDKNSEQPKGWRELLPIHPAAENCRR